MRVILIAVIVGVLAGCSVPRSIAEGGAISGSHVNPVGKVVLLNIADGQERGQPAAPGSGQGMVAAVRKVLSAHNVPFTTSEATTLATGVDEASKTGYDYVLKATITLWEDNATAWSGNGDKLAISVELYDAKSRQLIADATHKRVATGFTFVAGSPDRFMDEVAEGALSKIYGWQPTK